MAGSAQAATQWRAAYDRVSGMLVDASPEQLSTTVPACPDWSVHDLLSHVVGVDRDILAGTEDAGHSESWTGAQVDLGRERSTADVLTEWAAMADDVVTYITDVDPRPLGDLVIHEQDLRGALGAPGARDTAALTMIRDRMAGGLGSAVQERDLAPLRLESDDWTWSSGDGEPGAVLHADTYELTRALVSRRSAAQLRSWVVSGDVEPYLDAFAGIGPLPEESLTE